MHARIILRHKLAQPVQAAAECNPPVTSLLGLLLHKDAKTEANQAPGRWLVGTFSLVGQSSASWLWKRIKRIEEWSLRKDFRRRCEV